MSKESYEALESALNEHLKSLSEDQEAPVIGAWVVAYEYSHLDKDAEGKMTLCFHSSYACSDSSPMTTLGLATWLPGELAAEGDDDEDVSP